MHDRMDLHTHTIASGHAYSTLTEMIRAAADQGLELYGCSDHGPAMHGTLGADYFINFKVIPRELFGVKILMGAELNILDPAGSVDLSENILKKLDYAIASIHPTCYTGKTAAENTSAYLAAIKNPYIQIIGHPDDGRIPADYESLAAAAAEHGKLLEINNSSLSPKSFRKNSRENCTAMLEQCRRYRTHIIVNSDAHFYCDVGNHELAVDLLKEIGFPEELVANTSLQKAAQFFPKIKQVFGS